MKLYENENVNSSHEDINPINETPVTQEVLVAPENQATNDQVAEFEKVAAQLAAEGKKLIAYLPLTDRLANSLFLGLEELVALKQELAQKAQAATERNTIIKNRLDYLIEEKKMRLNTAHYEAFNESITTYVDLLAKITEEVEGEVLNCARYVSQTPPQFVIVMADESDNFHDHITTKIKWIKRHVKNIKKDLSISFSRYEVSFSHQNRQLDMLDVLSKQARPTAITEHDHAHEDNHTHAAASEKQSEHTA